VLAAKVAVGRGVGEDGAVQLEVTHNESRAEVKVLKVKPTQNIQSQTHRVHKKQCPCEIRGPMCDMPGELQ
jgi:hypothetical protein